MTVDLRLGDCLEILPTLADKSVDAVITDPPYNVGLTYSNGDNRSDYAEWCLNWLKECLRISPLVIITPGISNVWIYPKPEWICCWHKKFSGTRGGRVSVVNRWEPILLFGVPPKKLGGDVFEAMSDCYLTNHKGPLYDTGDHPCPKPLRLMQDLVKSSGAATVLDPFMGSGTTGAAAVMEGRNFIGIEINPQYFDIASRRISEAQKQMAMAI